MLWQLHWCRKATCGSGSSMQLRGCARPCYAKLHSRGWRARHKRRRRVWRRRTCICYRINGLRRHGVLRGEAGKRVAGRSGSSPNKQRRRCVLVLGRRSVEGSREYRACMLAERRTSHPLSGIDLARFVRRRGWWCFKMLFRRGCRWCPRGCGSRLSFGQAEMISDRHRNRLLWLLLATWERSSHRLLMEYPLCGTSVVEDGYFVMTRHRPCIESTILVLSASAIQAQHWTFISNIDLWL